MMFKSRAAEVTAIQYLDKESMEKINEVFRPIDFGHLITVENKWREFIRMPNGFMLCFDKGDWLVKLASGAMVVIKDGVFQLLYEEG